MAEEGNVYLPVQIFKGDRVILRFLEDFSERVNGLPGTAVADLNQTISASPTQAEVQAISDKIDALLAVLRTANVIES